MTAGSGGQLEALGFATYADYLASDHWRDVKRRYRASSRPQACRCGVKKMLQLHHLTYARVGAEEMDDLLLLCDKCHAREHGKLPPRSPKPPRISTRDLSTRYLVLHDLAVRTGAEIEELRVVARELLRRRYEPGESPATARPKVAKRPKPANQLQRGEPKPWDKFSLRADNDRQARVRSKQSGRKRSQPRTRSR